MTQLSKQGESEQPKYQCCSQCANSNRGRESEERSTSHMVTNRKHHKLVFKKTHSDNEEEDNVNRTLISLRCKSLAAKPIFDINFNVSENPDIFEAVQLLENLEYHPIAFRFYTKHLPGLDVKPPSGIIKPRGTMLVVLTLRNDSGEPMKMNDQHFRMAVLKMEVDPKYSNKRKLIKVWTPLSEDNAQDYKFRCSLPVARSVSSTTVGASLEPSTGRVTPEASRTENATLSDHSRVETASRNINMVMLPRIYKRQSLQLGLLWTLIGLFVVMLVVSILIYLDVQHLVKYIRGGSKGRSFIPFV